MEGHRRTLSITAKTYTRGRRELADNLPVSFIGIKKIISRTLVQFPDGVCYLPEPSVRSCHQSVVVARFVGASSCIVISLPVLVASNGRNPPPVSSRTFSRMFCFLFRFVFFSIPLIIWRIEEGMFLFDGSVFRSDARQQGGVSGAVVNRW